MLNIKLLYDKNANIRNNAASMFSKLQENFPTHDRNRTLESFLTATSLAPVSFLLITSLHQITFLLPNFRLSKLLYPNTPFFSPNPFYRH